MPPKAKHKTTNQHRHESGLVKPAPGKRLTKQRSSNQLSTANGQHSLNPAHPDGLNDNDVADDSPASLPDDDMVAAPPAPNTPQASAAPSESSRRVSDAPVYPSAANTKLAGRSVSSTFSMAMTILSACPLSDAIAILILLLSLPPTLIITIHTLFASLTFVPPSAGVSWSSWNGVPSLGDWFHATAAGGPSLFTIFFVDGVMTLIYLCSSLLLQNIYLDLGQAVIAISLSGATAAKGGSANNVAICSIIVFLSHFLRYNKIHLTGLEYLRSLLQNLGTGLHWNPVPPSSFSPSPSVIYGWPRTLLGCHILAQGLLTLVRRTLAGYANHTRGSASNRQDPEAASYGDAPKTSISPGDSGQEPPGGLGSDGRPPGPSPAMRESNQRISTSRKKKRHATQVRSRQPLWAAIASTKVTFYKEMEQKQASIDQAEAVAYDSTQDNASIQPKISEDRIAVIDMRPTDILFRANLPTFSNSAHSKLDPNTPISAGIDKTKPFFVRMNGADWGSTKITQAEGEEALWNGEIFGLTPLTNYSCELIRMSDHHVLCTTSLVTLPAPSAEQTSIVSAPPQPQSLRPLSPISTLKQSIAAAEMKREEARNKLKRTRRDHKNAASAVRKEIDQLNAKVASSGGQDERQRQRILQLTQHLRQASEATTALKDETDAMGDIPEAELREYNEKKRAWQATCDRKSAALADLEAAKSHAQREIAQVTSELTSAAQKRERLSTRKGKLTEQLDRLTNQKKADLNARQKHEHERANRVAEYQRQEAQLLFWTQQTDSLADENTLRANEAFAQMDYLNNMISQQQQTLSGPPTPEGNLPGTNGPPNRQPTAFDFSMFGGFGQGLGGFRGGAQGRGRSSSMLSGYSGFTDDDLDAIPGAENGQHEALLLEDDKGKGRLASSPIGNK